MRHQNIGCSQVSVNVILLLNKGHAVSHLQGTAHHQTSPVSACSSMKRMSVWLLVLCNICVRAGQRDRNIPKPGSLPLPQVSSLYPSPRYFTRVLHPGTQLCLLYFLILRAAAIPLPYHRLADYSSDCVSDSIKCCMSHSLMAWPQREIDTTPNE